MYAFVDDVCDACMCAYMQVCMYAYAFVCMLVCMHVSVHVCMCVCVGGGRPSVMHTCMHACDGSIYVGMRVYICMYLWCTCAYMHVCMHACADVMHVCRH